MNTRLHSAARALKRHDLLPFALAVLLAAYVFSLQCLAVDFGTHWDEELWGIGRAAKSWAKLDFTPATKAYPGLSHDIAIVASVPAVVKHLAGHAARGDRPMASLPSVKSAMSDFTFEAMKKDARRAFALVSCFAILFVFFITRELTGKGYAALFAAACMAASWEFFYHARWGAADTLQATFALLSAYFLLKGKESKNLLYAALCCALATACKYQAGILLPFIIIAALATAKEKIRYVCLIFCVFIGTFYIVSPYHFIQPMEWMENIFEEFIHYKSWHSIYTIFFGYTENLTKILLYLPRIFSRYAPLSYALSALAVAGMARCAYTAVTAKDVPRLLAVALPVCFLLWYASNNVLIVRNLLLVAPYLAVFAAAGGAALYARIPGRRTRAALAGLACLAVIANLYAITGASLEIRAKRHLNHKAVAADLVAFLKGKGSKVYLSPAVQAEYGGAIAAVAAVTGSVEDADYGVVMTDDVVARLNDPGLEAKSFLYNRPGNVLYSSRGNIANFDYYLTWADNAVVILQPKALQVWLGNPPRQAAPGP